MHIVQHGSVAAVVYSHGCVDIFAENPWCHTDFDSVVTRLGLQDWTATDWEYRSPWDGHVEVWRIYDYECEHDNMNLQLVVENNADTDRPDR